MSNIQGAMDSVLKLLSVSNPAVEAVRQGIPIANNIKQKIEDSRYPAHVKEMQLLGMTPLTPEQFKKQQETTDMALNMSPMGITKAVPAAEKAAAKVAPKLESAGGKALEKIKTKFNISKGEQLPKDGALMPDKTITVAPETAMPEMTTGKPTPKLKEPNWLTKGANWVKSDISKARPKDIATNPRAPQEIKPMQDALKRHNVYDANQAGPAMDRIYNEFINPELTNNPKQAPISNIVDNVVAEMRKMEPSLSERDAKAAASKWINDLYSVSRGEGASGQLVPDNIDTKSLFEMKKNLNGTQAVERYFKDGTYRNADDLAAIASRNAFSKTLEGLHPDIAQLNKDYGKIAEAYPSLFQATQEPRKNILRWGTVPALFNGSKTVGSAALRNPKTTAGIAGAGLIGYGINELNNPKIQSDSSINQNSPDNQSQNNISGSLKPEDQTSQNNQADGVNVHSSGTLPQSTEDVKPIEGKYRVISPYDIKDAEGKPQFLSESDWANEKERINNEIKQVDEQLRVYSNTINPVTNANLVGKRKQLETELSSLDAKAQSSASVNEGYKIVSSINNQFDQVDEQLKKSDPATWGVPLIQGLGMKGVGADSIAQMLNPEYKALAQNLKQLEMDAKLPAGSLFQAGQTKDTLIRNLEAARKKVLSEFYTALKATLGNTGSLPTVPSTLPQGPAGKSPVTAQAAMPQMSSGGSGQGWRQVAPPNPNWAQEPMPAMK